MTNPEIVREVAVNILKDNPEGLRGVELINKIDEAVATRTNRPDMTCIRNTVTNLPKKLPDLVEKTSPEPNKPFYRLLDASVEVSAVKELTPKAQKTSLPRGLRYQKLNHHVSKALVGLPPQIQGFLKPQETRQLRATVKELFEWIYKPMQDAPVEDVRDMVRLEEALEEFIGSAEKIQSLVNKYGLGKE